VHTVEKSPNEQTSQPENPDAEPPDEKVIRLMPRRPVAKRLTDQPTHDDEDDPGPSAA
jgi:hypothetical protein